MTSVHYLVGRSVDSRQHLLADKVSSWDYGPILHLVPTRGHVIELEADTRFWLKKRVDTLAGVIQRIFEKDIRHVRFNGYRPVDDTFKSMLVGRLLERRAAQPRGLTYFKNIIGEEKGIDFSGIYDAISGYFSHLVENNCQYMSVNDLAGTISSGQASPGAGEERHALELDLAWLFGDYQEIKRKIRVYDPDDMIANVRVFLEDGGIPSIIAGSDVIVFDGYEHISRIEESILFHLFRIAQEVWWLIDYNTQPDNLIDEFKKSSGINDSGTRRDEGDGRRLAKDAKEGCKVFAPLVSLMDRLEAAGIGYSVEKAKDTPFLNPLAGGLYLNGQLDEAGFDSLRLRSFGSNLDEIRAIAAEIKRIIHEDNLDVSRDLGKIRVILPNLDDYSSLISELFSEYGLPFSLTEGLPLSSHPLSDIFIRIFKIVMDHFKREDIFYLFSSDIIRSGIGRSPAVDNRLKQDLAEYLLPGDTVSEVEGLISKNQEAFSSRFDISRLDSVILRCGINRLGCDLSALGKEGLLSVREFFNNDLRAISSAEEKERMRLEYYVYIIQGHILYGMLKPFQELAGQDTPKGIARKMSELLYELGLPDNIIGMPHSRMRLEPPAIRAIIKRDLKAYSMLNELISSCEKELSIANEIFQIGSGHDLLIAFYSFFRHKLDRAYLQDERNPNVIRVSQWLEIRGRAFDYIFAGGLTSDRFPLREGINFILPESSGKLFRVRDIIDLSRYLFSHLLRNYRKRLYLSYPRYIEEKGLQPSQVFTDIKSMKDTWSSAETDIGLLETIFKWEDNTYLTSVREMLNASVKKGPSTGRTDENLFSLRDVILLDERRVEGIIRGVKVLRCRSAVDGLFEYDGLVGQAGLYSKFLRDRDDAVSPIQLDILANCPMHYLFKYIYGLGVPKEVGMEASPAEMGQYIHHILSLLFRWLLDHGKNVSDIGLGRAFSKASEIAHVYAEKYPFLKNCEFFETQEKEFLAGLERDTVGSVDGADLREGVLVRLLRFEEMAFRDRVPEGIEYRFGYTGDNVLLGKTRLRGYLDRFDVDRRDRERVYIYDYKLGAVPSHNMVKKGLSFQLPAYIRALRTILGPSMISAAFYELKKEAFIDEEPIKYPINQDVDNEKGLDISGVTLIGDFADQLMENLEKGYFHQSSDGLECHYCEFMYACHRDSRRMAHLIKSGNAPYIYSGSVNLEKWRRVDRFSKEWRGVSEDMEKIFTLKTEKGRRTRFESIMKFSKDLEMDHRSLPFHDEYIDRILDKLKGFIKRYQSVFPGN